jgi:hypothetical protein
MSETADQSGAEAATESPDRRSLLKKAGVVGVGIWAAPIVTSLTSPAYAQGSPPSGRGCIVLPSASRVTGSYIAGANNTLAFGLVGGAEVCSNCSNNGNSSGTFDLGAFPAGAGLTFYFKDDGGGSCPSPDCNGYYECGSGTTHVAVQKVSDTVYKLYFVDAGCGCAEVAQDARQAGPGAANIDVTLTITPAP